MLNVHPHVTVAYDFWKTFLEKNKNLQKAYDTKEKSMKDFIEKGILDPKLQTQLESLKFEKCFPVQDPAADQHLAYSDITVEEGIKIPLFKKETILFGRTILTVVSRDEQDFYKVFTANVYKEKDQAKGTIPVTFTLQGAKGYKYLSHQIYLAVYLHEGIAWGKIMMGIVAAVLVIVLCVFCLLRGKRGNEEEDDAEDDDDIEAIRRRKNQGTKRNVSSKDAEN